MQASISETRPKQFVPVRVTIDLETEEEAVLFRHLLQCWMEPGCDEAEGVRAITKKILNSPGLRDLLPKEQSDG